MATAVRVRHASAAAMGEWNMPAQSSRAGGCHSAGNWSTNAALASNQCGRLPTRGLEEHRPEFLLPRVERADAQIAGRFLGLQRMQDVVDLDEVLLRRLADVAGVELHLFEPVHVAAVQRDLGPAVDQHLCHRAGHACGVRHPHRFGDPEAGDVG